MTMPAHPHATTLPVPAGRDFAQDTGAGGTEKPIPRGARTFAAHPRINDDRRDATADPAASGSAGEVA